MLIATLTPIGNSGKQRSSNNAISLSSTGTSSQAAVTPGYLVANPSNVDFGRLSDKRYGSNELWGFEPHHFQAAVTGVGFGVNGFASPETLAPGQSLTLTIVFASTGAGTSSGTITFVSDASDANPIVLLSGSGKSPGQLAVSPGSMSFATTVVLSGTSLPLTLAAGQSVPFTVTFAPQASGTASANISVTSNASTSSTTEVVTGTATSTIQHSVDLSWNQST